MELRLEKEYKTGLLASTDLHAGGIFFAIIYKKVLRFKNATEVSLYNEIINPLSPMDNQDVHQLEMNRQEGTYSFNERGYLACSFPKMKIELTGRITGDNKEILVFHQFDRHLSRSSSIVFSAEP
jgi:hypothetical protein